MMTNGMIISIQNQTTAQADGTRAWSANVISSPIACLIGMPTSAQIYRLGGIISGAQVTAFLPDRLVPAGVTISNGDLLIVQLKTDPEQTLEVMHIDHAVGRGALDHYEIFLKTN